MIFSYNCRCRISRSLSRSVFRASHQIKHTRTLQFQNHWFFAEILEYHRGGSSILLQQRINCREYATFLRINDRCLVCVWHIFCCQKTQRKICWRHILFCVRAHYLSTNGIFVPIEILSDRTKTIFSFSIGVDSNADLLNQTAPEFEFVLHSNELSYLFR